MFPMKLLSFIVPSITSKKIKFHFDNFVCGQMKPMLCKAKAGLVKILMKKPSTPVTLVKLILSQKKKKRTKKKKNSRKITNEKSPFGSFRLHYNFCSSSSSHVMPVSTYVMKEAQPHRDSDFSVENNDSSEHLSKYFDFVDEDEGGNSEARNSPNEIDKQAETFIAQNHAKFKLDKQHSYNKYKAMLARGC